jgi:2-oxoglutarate/2-oxoacid ferredoxin oxidoreductase subunit beta
MGTRASALKAQLWQLPRTKIDEADQRLADADPAHRHHLSRNLAEAALMNELTTITTAKDWASDQEVRWCPGCGDYAVLKAVQRTMPDLSVAREKTVFVSGIGCSSRFPYYMASYGFHTIHGRAPAIATGVKLANPELDVWIITGDGDALSIGGNHTMHVLRRNLDCQILLFNNEIYGLTKGQYSPTSRVGTRSPSTPFGSVDRPVTPCAFALGSGARFIARGIDVHKNLPDVLKAAHAHRGASFVEIYQNCVVYNDDVFASFTERGVAQDKQLWLKPGEKMLFANGTKGLALDTEHLALKVVAGDDPLVLVHDPKNRQLAAMLILMPHEGFPIALGVIYEDPAPTFESAVVEQNKAAAAGKKADLQALVSKGQTWMVDKEPKPL